MLRLNPIYAQRGDPNSAALHLSLLSVAHTMFNWMEQWSNLTWQFLHFYLVSALLT